MPPAVMPANAIDFLSPRIWTDVVRLLPRPDDLIGDMYLPRKDVAGDRLMWEILDSDNPMAPMVALGAESPRMDGRQAQFAWADILYTRFKRVLREQDLRILRAFGDSGFGPLGGDIAGMRAASEQYIRDEATRVSEAIDRRINWLQLHALQGLIQVRPDDYTDMNYDITYNVVPQAPLGATWDNVTTADPLLDMTTWFHLLRWKPARAIMTRADAFLLMRNQNIRAQVFANVPTGASTQTVLSEQGLLAWLKGMLGLDVAITWSVTTTRTNTGSAFTYTEQQYLPDGKMIILPAGPIGYTGEAPAQLNNYQTGKFTFSQDPTNGGPIDPPETMFGCGWYGLPVINHPEQVIVATIHP